MVERDTAKTQSPESFLYTNVLKEHLGEVASIIVSSLISNGRLTARDLSSRTKLSLKQTKTCLVSLIQLNCVQYWNEGRLVYYTFHDTGVLNLFYSGEIINAIKSLYNERYAEIIQNVLQLGHLKISDYIKTIKDAEERFEVEDVFYKLYIDGWLKKLSPYDFNPIGDIWNKTYQDILKTIPRTSTTSEVKRVAQGIEQTKLKFTTLLEVDSLDLFRVDGGIRKLNPITIVTFNLERFQKRCRSMALMKLARARVGPLSATIYSVVLRCIENNSPDIHHPFTRIPGLINDPEEMESFLADRETKLIEQKKITVSIREIMKSLPAELDLRNSILNVNFAKPAKRVKQVQEGNVAKKVKLENGTAIPSSINDLKFDEEDEDDAGFDYDYDIDNSDPHSSSLITHHLKLLCDGCNIPFLLEVNPGVFAIPFKQLIAITKEQTYDNIIKTCLGPRSSRVLKCIKESKLADEKNLSNTILLKEKQLRNDIYSLIRFNSVEIQEVPRSADRAASKTFFAFRHKPAMSYQYISKALCYNMAEILSNITEMRQHHRILLEKCERDDVKGKEAELLLDSELKTLRDIQNREINCMGSLHRVRGLYEVFGVY